MPSRTRYLDESDVADFAFGCALMGTGGGGAVGDSALQLSQAIRMFGPVPVVTLDELAEDGLVMPLSSVGAPTVSYEMLSNGNEAAAVRAAVEKEFGAEVVAVIASEIGGGNGVEAAMWASRLGLPVIDGDGMGRAFPEVQMVSFHVSGARSSSLTMSDLQGNVATFRPANGAWSEPLARAFAVACGGAALMADFTMPASEMRGKVIEGSVSKSVSLGRAARGSSDPVDAVQQELDANRLISGKVVDLERRTGGGFVRGSFRIEGTGTDKGRSVRIEIQNENLVALEGNRLLASVPDLITVVDSQNAVAIATEELVHGMRVSLLAWACDSLWRSTRGLETAGPRAFGYDIDYTPIEELHRA